MGLTNREHTLKLFSMNSLRVSQEKQKKRFAIKLNSCIIKVYFQKEEIMKRAELIVAREDRVLFVLKGAKQWIEERAIAYRNAGFNILIKEVVSCES